jgi:acetyl esterase
MTVRTILAVFTGVICLACSTQPDDAAVLASGASQDSLTVDSAAARSSEGTVTPALSVQQDSVLLALAGLNGRPLESLSAAEARRQPTVADAVAAVLRQQERPVQPEPVTQVEERSLPTAAGAVPVRIYTPKRTGPMPVIVYFHGGGFVVATNATYDATARALANAVDAIVVSVEYRKAPEHRFPAAHDDAVAAYRWVARHAASIGGHSSRVALAGESAGGNLAVATAVSVRSWPLPQPVAILAVYPVASTDTTTDSYREHAAARPLNRAMMTWFLGHYAPDTESAADPRLNLLAANLTGLPPTTIITAEADPLRSDGELLARRLKDAGVDVELRNYQGVAHEFFGQGAVVKEARDAVRYAANRLEQQLKG